MREAYDRRLSILEFEQVINPHINKLNEHRLESAKKAIGVLYDDKIGVDTPSGLTSSKLDLESPEGLEQTAKILRDKADKIGLMSPKMSADTPEILSKLPKSN